MNHGLKMEPPAELIARIRPHAERAGCWRPVPFAKGRRISCRDEAGARLIIIERGLVKLSYTDAEGDERVKSFIAAEGLFELGGADGALSYDAVCLEPTRAVALPLAWVGELAGSDAEVRRAVDAFWLWLSARKRAREHALLCSTPLQRYLAFQTGEPMLAARLPQGDIARYLGVTPVAFSRIKRRLRSPLQAKL